MSIISAGTTQATGLNYTSDTTGNLVLQTNNGVTALTVDTSQRVGIGTSSPATRLDVNGGASVTGNIENIAPSRQGVFIGRDGANTNNCGIDIVPSATGVGWLDFTTTGSDWKGRVIYDNSSNVMGFHTNGSERVRISATGDVGIGYSSPTQKLDVAGTVVADLSSFGQFHAVAGGGSTWYNAMIRNDASDVYFLSSSVQTTRAAAAAAQWNAFRPFTWNLANGSVSIDGTGAGVNVAARPAFFCRAWVNFNGTGTVAIRASGNVTSITDNGTGDYTVNFTTAMADANFAGVVSASGPVATQHNVTFLGTPGSNDASSHPNSSSFRFSTYMVTNSGTRADGAMYNVAVFR